MHSYQIRYINFYACIFKFLIVIIDFDIYTTVTRNCIHDQGRNHVSIFTGEDQGINMGEGDWIGSLRTIF